MKRHSSPALRLGSAALVLATTSSFLAAGCGASSGFGESKVTSMESLPAPHNLSEAEALFDSSEREVFAAFGQDKRDAQRGFAEPPPGQFAQQPASPAATTTTGGAPPPPPADSYRPPNESEAKAAGASATPVRGGGDSAPLSSSPCVTACKALASMDRAATHICELAGYNDARCTNARERVRVATERVRQSCSDCSGP